MNGVAIRVELAEKYGMTDAEMLVAWLRESADELEKAHAVLDSEGVPQDNPDTGRPFTLAARIAYMAGVR